MSASRARGTRWESELCDYFRAHGHPLVERRALRGVKDSGDLIFPGYVMEAKNVREWRLNEWMTDAAKKAYRERVDRYVVLIKRKQHSTADGYAVMPVWLLCELLADDEEIAS